MSMFWCCCSVIPQVSEAPESTEVVLWDTQAGSSATQRGLRLAEDDREAARLPTLLQGSKPWTKGGKTDEAAQEELEEESSDGTFDVTLHMTPGERLGALLDVLDMKTLRVKEIRSEGRLRIYNSRAKDNKKVLPGYYIVCVNGKSGKAEEMVDEMRRSRTWQLKVARKQEFIVKLEKDGPLRLDLQFEKESDCIVIRKIGDGLVKQYNQSLSDAEPQVKPGDRILDVNDVGGPAKTMLETIKGNTDLTMKLARPFIKSECE